MPNNAEISLCGGFFLIYFIDEFVHFLFGEVIIQNASINNGDRQNHENEIQSYGSTDVSESAALLGYMIYLFCI